ncbi:MarR family winged helix-turn-helix transcriptional regulator [Algihabitans albus]|uniref:MarR family winged helix-turn-helix transcriptional regulator n=1 Tax=Algihabitans albus TaxID=2164067 RepID=UPI001ABCE38E|nr:MarR family transcriptional regulator [Algihabitans albus]
MTRENDCDRAARAVAQWRREFPDWDLRPMEVLGRLSETAAVIERNHLAPLFAAFGLQPGEFDVLASLRRSGAPYEMTPTQLFEITMLSSGGMTARIDRLERMGFVARRHNPEDRRGILVSLTPTGRDLIERAVPEHLANQTRLTAVLTAEELCDLSALLKKLLRHAQAE